MQYRIVPKNGDKLSALGFGAMRLPQRALKIDEQRAIKQIRFAIDNGVNYLDTAPVYHGGESEKLLGKALEEGYRKKVKIATKLSPMILTKAEGMEKMLNMQLSKLQTKYIDYYLLHGLDEQSWQRLLSFNVLKFLERAKKEGKIVNTGFSFHDSKMEFKEIVDSNDWVMCQIQYNFLDEEFQAGTEGLKYAASNKLAVMVMEPLRGGLLAGRLPREVKQIYESIKPQRTAAEWALRWVWNHPEVTVVLSGMNNEKQIDENIITAETSLPNSMSEEELSVIGRVARCYRGLMKVPCTGCSYCMPCPTGVNIPSNFQIYNQYSILDKKLVTRAMYAAMLMGAIRDKPADASLCINCGLCVKKCPQHIAIPKELKAVKRELGGLRTKVIKPLIKQYAKRQFKKND
jgi:predicted aldo/keto reductase-like oxidoreductase